MFKKLEVNMYNIDAYDARMNTFFETLLKTGLFALDEGVSLDTIKSMGFGKSTRPTDLSFNLNIKGQKLQILQKTSDSSYAIKLIFGKYYTECIFESNNNINIFYNDNIIVLRPIDANAGIIIRFSDTDILISSCSTNAYNGSAVYGSTNIAFKNTKTLKLPHFIYDKVETNFIVEQYDDLCYFVGLNVHFDSIFKFNEKKYYHVYNRVCVEIE